MNESVFVAIDMGTELIKIISVVYNREENKIRTLLKTTYPSSGFLKGYIIDTNDASKSLGEAINRHQKEVGIIISEAFFSIGGIGVSSRRFRIPHTIAGSEVTNFDLGKIEGKSKIIIDKKIPGYLLEHMPIKYTIDGFDHYSSPLRMEAKKIYTDYFYLSTPKNHLTSMETVISNNSVTPLDITPGILSVSDVILSTEDKKNGCILVDLGSETTSVLVFKNNKPLHLGILPIGSKDITLEISKKEKIDFLEAEYKKKHEKLTGATKIAVDKKLKEIAKEIKVFLRDNLDGDEKSLVNIILIGGGSKVSGIKNIFKQVLSLAVKKNKSSLLDKNTDFSIASSLIISSLKKEKNKNNNPFFKFSTSFKKFFRKILKKMSV